MNSDAEKLAQSLMVENARLIEEINANNQNWQSYFDEYIKANSTKDCTIKLLKKTTKELQQSKFNEKAWCCLFWVYVFINIARYLL